MDFSKIEMINAGAGSGKTYKITELLFDAVDKKGVKPSQIFATTFTNKAAAELVQRVRAKFLETVDGSARAKDNALLINEARIGTLHSLCGEYLKRFAFDLGLSPDVEVLDEVGADNLFLNAIDEEEPDKIKELSRLGRKLSITSDSSRDDGPIDYVKKIASEATANGIDAVELPVMGDQSWSLYDKLLDEACGKVDKTLTVGLINSVTEDCLTDLSGIDEKTKAQQNFKDLLRGLKNKRWCSKWSHLESIKVPSKAAEHFEPFINLQTKLGQFGAFRADIKAFIQLAYEVAANSLSRYRELKDNRGVLDFSDLERQFFELLDNPAVQKIIKEELKLLLVDEFQDTNPMQLAIYLKLTELVDKAVFVGDLKQAIYGFRGSDPELMIALQNELESQGITIDKLETSRRSTETIVEHCNDTFNPVFGEEQTKLEVWDKLKRKPSCGSPELFSFSVSGRKKAAYQAFANKLKLFVANRPLVLDKHTDIERPMRWDDIGILTSTNDGAKELAKILNEAKIPAQCEQPGLLEEPEVVLIHAFMALISGDDNKIAYAEIRSIVKNQGLDDWLGELLEDTEKPGRLLDTGLMEKIAGIRKKTAQLSPTELLTEALNNFAIAETVRQWDNNEFTTQLRLANIDALYKLVEGYEQEAVSYGLPVTMEGLNRYLAQKAWDMKDIKGISTGRAVSVLTIHKSKGLEWPCVILEFMEKSPRDRLFGVTAKNDSDSFYIDKPLKGRWVQFLPRYNAANASTKLEKKTVKAFLHATEFGKKRAEETRNENHRLLYVAFTRARNYLSFIDTGKAPDDSFKQLLSEDAYSFSDVSENWPIENTVDEDLQLPFVRHCEQELKPRYIHPSATDIDGPVEVDESSQYGEALRLAGSLNTAKLGDALHQLIGFIVLNTDKNVELVARRLLVPFTSDEAQIKKLVNQAQQFVACVKEQFKPKNVWVEMPVTAKNEANQTIKGSIDLLLETEAGLVVIDHKLKGAKTPDKQQELARFYGGQLKTYKKALELNGYTVQALVLNAFSSGTLVNVKDHSACDS